MTQTTTPSETTNTPARLTEHQVRDLVNQLAAAAGVLRPSVAFLPWLDDQATVIQTAYRPGRRHLRARIDIAQPALAQLSAAAWRHLLAHEIGHLKLHHSRAVAVVQDSFDVIGTAFLLAALAWFALREQSIGILAAGLGVAVLASMAHYGWYLRCELQADRYAARIAGVDHATVNEIWNHLEQRAGMTLGEHYLRHRLRQLADRAVGGEG